MRSLLARELTYLSKDNKDLVLLSGDIGNKMFDDFKKISKNRFFNCGIAEANMMSMAAGMAICGLRPIIYTITPFTTTRCLEQIKIGAAYHNSNIIIVGTGSGLSYAELGPTHHSFEDIAILRSIPKIRIITPSDPNELKVQLKEALSISGPSYIRIGKKGEPNLFDKNQKLGIGKSNIIHNGSDILILTIGPIASEALKAAKYLSLKGISVCVACLGSIRPLDQEFLLKMSRKDFKYWITLEEHGLIGGLGSTILEWVSQINLLNTVKLKMIGIPNLEDSAIAKDS